MKVSIVLLVAVYSLTGLSLASERLAEAEATSSNDHRRAQRDSHAYHSSIYPAGSEFALCHAESQLMSAVVGVLNESLTESIRGFYKLRKAYVTLDGILEAESRYMRTKNGWSVGATRNASMESLTSNTSARSMKVMPGGFGDESAKSTISQITPSFPSPANAVTNRDIDGRERVDHADALDDEDVDDFYDADEAHDQSRIPTTYLGHIGIDSAEEEMKTTSLDDVNTPNFHDLGSPKSPSPRTNHHVLDHDPDSDVFSNPIDIFVHSGSNLCFGLLLLMISMIPPAFSKLLFIIGFRGDRERGIRMLWQASKFQNINGAMAGLIILGYYNGLIGFCDILPDAKSSDEELEAVEGYPRYRLEALLTEMRKRYPKSHLWLLEEARMQASNRRLEVAVELLSRDTKSPLKQVEALDMFEKSLNAMYLHRHALCADSFVKCVSLNNWSHALYYYIAGSSHVELYRAAKASSDTKATAAHAEKATELLRIVPKHAGKKKFMARQLPFDVFVTRKILKWEARTKEWNVPFIEAIGISPIEEMIYFWNGYKRMTAPHLEESLKALKWSEDLNQNPHWEKETLDERAVLTVLRAAILRNLGKHEEAKALLKKEVISHDRSLFKGHLRDDWTCPTAHYEMGVNLWMQRSRDGSERDQELVKECSSWISKTAAWEAYDLDARIGLKVTTAQDTLKKLGKS